MSPESSSSTASRACPSAVRDARFSGSSPKGTSCFKEQGPAERQRRLLSRLGGKSAKEAKKALAIKVLDAMTSPAITVSPYCSVAEAARLMSEHGVNRLPVMKGDELIGIVTRTDLVKAFIRSDEQIREEIKEDLLRRTLWLEVPGSRGRRGQARRRSADRKRRDPQRGRAARAPHRARARRDLGRGGSDLGDPRYDAESQA